MSYNVNIGGQSDLNCNPTNAVPLTRNKTRDPNQYDSQNFTLGWHWLNESNNALWYLAALTSGVATWILIAGSTGDVNSVTGTTGITITGTANDPIVGLTIPVVVTSGGTGNITLTNHSVLLGAGTSPITQLANGTTGQILTANTGADPIWSTIDSATSFITNPATGTATPAAGVLTFAGAGGITTSASGSTVTITGSGTGSVFTSVKRQVFTTSGTYTPTAGMLYCDIEVCGGGGGGGGSVATGSSTTAGSGGGGGGYARGIYSAAAIGASQSVTIGAGGTGGVGGGAATNGGTTSVGALLSATGGGLGISATIAAVVSIGLGSQPGIGTGGDYQTAGNGSGGGLGVWISTNTWAFGGFGGGSFFGGGALVVATTGNIGSGPGVNGNAGSLYGGGGGGAVSGANSNAANGGAGFAGVVIVTEFI